MVQKILGVNLPNHQAWLIAESFCRTPSTPLNDGPSIHRCPIDGSFVAKSLVLLGPLLGLDGVVTEC